MTPFLSLPDVLSFLPEMRRLKVSEVARSPRGFLTAYRRAGTSRNLSDKWKQRREGFIARHMAQYRKHPTYRRRLALIAWAYDPEKKWRGGDIR